MMNKKGGLVLRDVMFMLFVFAALMALMSIFVEDMSAEYGNAQMKADFNSGTRGGVGSLGTPLMGDLNRSVDTIKTSTDGGNSSQENLIGSFSSITGAIKGAAQILGVILSAPSYVGQSIGVILEALLLPEKITYIIETLINLIVYSLIIFVIVSALLKGGKV